MSTPLTLYVYVRPDSNISRGEPEFIRATHDQLIEGMPQCSTCAKCQITYCEYLKLNMPSDFGCKEHKERA